MKKINLSLLFLLLIGLAQGFAQGKNTISVKDLPHYLKQKNTLLISLQKESDYQEGHIEGSINFNLWALNNSMAMLLPNDTVATILGVNGISNTMKIILYDNANTKLTGRMYWVLSYMGANDVNILNGGYKAWKAADMPISNKVIRVSPADFSPHINSNYLATMKMVQSSIKNNDVVIIDARSGAEFDGTDETSLKQGHIPTAIHLNYTNMLNEDGELKSAKKLKSVFKEAGVTKDKTIILYCKSSVRAGIEFYTLNQVLGYPHVKVYDGAFKEWQSDAANKVEK